MAEVCNLKVSPSLKSSWDGGNFAKLLFDKGAETNLPVYRFWQWNKGVPLYSHNAVMREGKWNCTSICDEYRSGQRVETKAKAL